MANSDHYPASGKTDTTGHPVSGKATSGDPTNEPGQYPVGGWGDAIFGGPLPSGTGAPGSAGAARGGSTDATNEPGQVSDSLTGITDHDIGSTGAPGTQGAQDGSGGEAITYTYPNDGIGPYATTTVNDDLSGTRDSTQANDEGYGSAFAGQLPGVKGNEPEAGTGRYQPSGGHVLRGGRDVRP